MPNCAHFGEQKKITLILISILCLSAVIELIHYIGYKIKTSICSYSTAQPHLNAGYSLSAILRENAELV